MRLADIQARFSDGNKIKAQFVKRTREELLTFPGVSKVRPCPIPITHLRVSSFTRARLIRSYSLL